MYPQLTQDLGIRSIKQVKAQILCPSGVDLVTVFPISLQWKTLRYLLSSLGFGDLDSFFFFYIYFYSLEANYFTIL